MLYVVGLLFLLGIGYAATNIDPCRAHKLLKGKERLWSNVVSNTGNVSSFLCDDVRDGWYRLQEGEVATLCVQPYHCGTRAPVWMRGAVPTPQDGEVSREFCVNHDLGHNLQNCCTFSFNMEVRNCGGFMIYNMEERNILCPMALCVGYLLPCPAGEVSATGFRPCKYRGLYPYGLKVGLTGPVLTSDGFAFTCEFSYDVDDPFTSVDVSWKFNGRTAKTETVKYPVKNATLDFQAWNSHIGQNLSCSIRSYYRDLRVTKYSPVVSSFSYWGGIRITTSADKLIEGEITTLLIQSTLPVVCSSPRDKDCHLPLRLKWEGDSGILTIDSCNVSLKRTAWNSTTKTVQTFIQVTPTIEPLVKTDSTHRLGLYVESASSVHDMWKSYTTHIQLDRTDTRHQDCFIFGESNVRAIYMDHLFGVTYPGDYLFYNTPQDSDNQFMVQTRHRSIDGSLPSVCGVAVDSNGHVVIIDMCNDFPDKTEPIIVQRGTVNETGDVKIVQCGPADYELTNDLDVRVEVKVHVRNLEVYLHIPPPIAGRGHRGLCAYNQTGIILDPVTRQRLTLEDEKNLFMNPQRTSQAKQLNNTKSYCDCTSKSDECPRPSRGPVHDPVENLLTFCREIIPRSANLTLAAYTPKYYEIPNRAWPTGSGITKSEATARCEDGLRSFVSSHCSTLSARPGFTDFVDACVSDVQSTDSFEYMQSALQGFLWNCQIILLEDVSNYLYSRAQYIPPAEVTSDLCKDFCNMKGNCSLGTCDCDAGYVGDDCGVKKGETANIVDILGGQQCRSHTRQCSQVVFFTKGVLKTADFRVKLNPIKFVYGEPKSSNNEVIWSRVTFDSRYTIGLDLSPFLVNFTDTTVYGFDIAISNDGITYSDKVTYLVYNEICHTCSSDMHCYQNERSCRIDYACYSDGDRNPNNPKQCCIPAQSILDWITCP